MVYKTLPEKYYLNHFKEFLAYIEATSRELLSFSHLEFIDLFKRLALDTQCLLVRTCNRKHAFIKLESLDYPEINEVPSQIRCLFQHRLLRPICASDLPQFFTLLTRAELCALLKGKNLATGLSTLKKQELVHVAEHMLSFSAIEKSDVLSRYGVRNFDETLYYFLFLYFGDLSGKLNYFSMRDLGVMSTRRESMRQHAHFDTRESAQNAFEYGTRLKRLKTLSLKEKYREAIQLGCVPRAHGTQAQIYQDDYLLALGKSLLNDHASLALSVLDQSQHPMAQEKWLRTKYKLGDHEEVKTRLTQICEQPDSDYILTFAEDFLARKFAKKRTSNVTDMLRDNSQTLSIDELYRNAVEQGVIGYYRSQKIDAFECENHYWRALFGIVFWQILNDLSLSSQANEFDRRPRVLLNNQFYSLCRERIEALLSHLHSTESLKRHITQIVARHYGQPNGVFRWTNSLLDRLLLMVEGLGVSCIARVLQAMAKDYLTYRDGFPDLMVKENNKLRFEEVKAPGDHLRKNQLLTIRMLRQAGVDCRITRVDWIMDPNQAYSVVDIETTGGRSAYHRIIEIGVAKFVNGQCVDTWQSLIHPGCHIPRSITQLTGIDDSMVLKAPTFASIASSLRAFLSGSIFVAHNVNFDYGFIRQEFKRIDETFSMPKLCTVREMRKAKPGLPSYSLANLTKTFNIQMERHHRALSDAMAAGQLLQIVNTHRFEQSV